MLPLRYALRWQVVSAMLLLVVLASAVMPAIWLWPDRVRIIAAGLVGFGILIELCQRLVGYRSAEWLDIGADVIGVAIGLLIGLAGAGGWSQRFENWYILRGAGGSVD
jgi:hypothetical protein